MILLQVIDGWQKFDASNINANWEVIVFKLLFVDQAMRKSLQFVLHTTVQIIIIAVIYKLQSS